MVARGEKNSLTAVFSKVGLKNVNKRGILFFRNQILVYTEVVNEIIFKILLFPPPCILKISKTHWTV